jgi:transcriptional regulator with XRE-family HTH domain
MSATAMPKGLYSARYQAFRALLVAQRHEAGLTQAALADRLSKPQSFVAKYERGERRVDVVEFIEIAEAIGFNPADAISQLLD